MALNIVFAGTPLFALPSLQVLLQSTHRVIAVYTQPDRPAGRGRQLTESPVKTLATAAGLKVFQPLSLRDDKAVQQLIELQPDLMIVVAYGMILPPAILKIPRYGCVNVHASLLPRWRGASPIQQAILHGDQHTGITLMQMNEGLDTGAILAKSECDISETDTSGTLQNRLADLGAKLLLPVISALENQTIIPEPQPNEGATYAPKIQKKDAEINWTDSAIKIGQLIRAMNPEPIAFARFEEDRIRIWEATPLNDTHSALPGTILRVDKQGVDVATGDGVLRLLQLQLPGKTAEPVSNFIQRERHILQRQPFLF